MVKTGPCASEVARQGSAQHSRHRSERELLANPSLYGLLGFAARIPQWQHRSTFIWRGSCRTPLLTPWVAALAMVVLPTSFVRTSRHLVLLITALLAGEHAVASKGTPGLAAAGGTRGVPPAMAAL